MERQILHVVIPSFPIALARARDPHLRTRAVAVAPANSERALLQCVSPEATSEGLTAGMPLFRARRLCPALVTIPPDLLEVARGTRLLGQLAAEFTPLIEPGAGRLYLDLTASRRLFGPARDVAARLEKGIARQLGVEAMAGAGLNKLVSRVAADAMPEPGVYDVFTGAERSFLAPFPVTVLPGVGEERQGQLFRDLNLQRVEEVAALSLPQLRIAVGPFAALLHERACGIDRSPVEPPRRREEIAEEALLDVEENEDRVLVAELCRLAEGCGLQLRRSGRSASAMALTIGYADGVTEQGKKALHLPLSLDLALFAAAEELFLRVCRRRVRVRSLRLSCGAKRAEAQMDLFPAQHEPSARDLALQETLDRLREKHGAGALKWGRTVQERREQQTEPLPDASDDTSAYRYCTLTTRGG